MLLPTLPLVFLAAVAALYFHLRRQPTRVRIWRRALAIGLGVGAARAAIASAGWYMVEHTGGPLQVPAFALAMLAWPEAAMLDGRRVTAAPPEFYAVLSVVLVASTTAVAVAAAAVADGRR
jgi:hypothetical protein